MTDDPSAPSQTVLEVDDIEAAILQPRPSPYVGTHLLFRIDDRRAGQ